MLVSDQAEAFGFPNPLIGIAGFAALATIGVVLVAGAELPRWLWLAIQAGVTFAFGFVCWLIFQSVYRIEALCPYCMVVWVATVVSFVYVTVHNLAEGRLAADRRSRSASLVVRYHGFAATVLLLVIVAILGQAFWDHWKRVLL